MELNDAAAAAAARAHLADQSRRQLFGAPDALAPPTQLRHRLFPRAMAWDAAAVDDLGGAFAAQLHAVSLQERGSPAQPLAPTLAPAPAAVHEALSFARSLPLLHAASGAIESELRRQKENRAAPSNSSQQTQEQPLLAGAPPSQEAREKLFRTMGKWFDGPGSGGTSAANSRGSFASSTGSAAASDDGFLQHIPRRANFENVAPPPVLSISIASTAATSYTSLGRASFSAELSTASSSFSPVHLAPAATSNSFSGDPSYQSLLFAPDAAFATPKAASFSGMTALPVHRESRGTPSPTNSNSNWSVASEPRSSSARSPPRTSSSSSYGKKRQRATPAPSLAKALLTGCGAKRCSFEDCVKIAVSKGLCRGHGGGRRCQFAGCNKCAQSRSPYCWAHGGGKRCEAPNCRRSRKTKHFCVDHVEMEAQLAASGASPGDSDDSMDGGGGGGSMAASDGDVPVKKSFSSSDLPKQEAPFKRQFQQKRSADTAAADRRANLALQLPSLNDALKRSFPSPDAFQVAQANELLVLRLQQQQLQQLQQQQQQSQRFNFDIRR